MGVLYEGWKVKGLASHILLMVEKQLADDWEKLYAYRPVLLETYAECGRFKGSCYTDAGWLRVGKTSCRDRKDEKKPIPEEIFIKPICDTCRTQLCSTPNTSTIVGPPQEQETTTDRVEEDSGRAELEECRLTARFLKMFGQVYEHPQANIQQISESEEEMKTEVDLSKTLHTHIQATIDRLHEHQTILVATDTGQCWIHEEIGGKKDPKTSPIEQKESYNWIKAYRAVCNAQKQCQTTQLVMIADREGDIHELFCERLDHNRNAELLVRAERSRNQKAIDANGDYDDLWTHLEAQPILTTQKLLIPQHEGRPARFADLHIRSTKTTLKPPQTKKDYPEITLSAIYATEHNPPEDEAPLEWMFLSTVDVTNASDALTQLEWYTKRWGIEMYHQIFKIGYNREGQQLDSAERIYNCLAIDLVVAWRIFLLTIQERETPECDCSPYFSENEWIPLSTFVEKIKPNPTTPPTLNKAIALLERLGGHSGRVGDGKPSSEALWRGMTRLSDISEAYRICA